ncbi:MFS transporter [Brachybacterium halotolerans subsp. kimchii]|uniref:MFS transporter n=1 Tax=Brachybacterium halotolerans TaxID=2795215 RepID=UPI001E605248|nr:MFS transporter [Brachybacterium halotolerans]UEJ83865.1 MFS transporter [Brachybacterium halotolerans subsp. kimchii]
MSTAAPDLEVDPTVDPTGSPNILGPRLRVPAMGIKPDRKKPIWYVIGIFLGQFGLFVALMGPATVSVQMKARTLSDIPAEQASIAAAALAPGAIAALIFNALGGRLSDRTRSGLGRRRPWIIGGAFAMCAAILIMAIAPNVVVLATGWFIAQACANMAYAAYTASLADQLPDEQYGKVSGIVGIAQNSAIMAATWLASFFGGTMVGLFMIPAVLGFLLVTVYALMIPDPVLKQNRYPFNVRELVTSFWTNPLKFPDFGLAWWGRFMIILASYLFISFRVLFMTNHLGLEDAAAATAVATGVTIYTVLSMVAGLAAGWISDRIGRRKVLVAGSILVFGLGTYMLAHVDSVGGFFLCEAIMGLAYGTYLAVDLALVFEVLPDRKTSGKDLGVFNMANALPQSIAPALGGMLLARIGGGTDFTVLFVAAAISGVIGAVLTMFIRGVK